MTARAESNHRCCGDVAAATVHYPPLFAALRKRNNGSNVRDRALMAFTMAEIIQLWEFQQARRRVERRHDEQQNLERAVQLMRENLAAAADELREAPIAEQAELLDRIEQLTAMIRYGMRMLNEPSDPRPAARGDQHR